MEEAPGMRLTTLTVAGALAVLALAGCHSNENCLSVRPWYRGTQRGVYVERHEGPTGSGLALSEMAGPFDTRSSLSGSASCWGPARGVEEPGNHLIAWLDTRRDLATLSALCAPLADAGSPDCAPQPGDARGELTFTMPPSGLLTLDLELLDP